MTLNYQMQMRTTPTISQIGHSPRFLKCPSGIFETTDRYRDCFEDVFVNSSNKDTQCTLEIILSSNWGIREALQLYIHFCLCPEYDS